MEDFEVLSDEQVENLFSDSLQETDKKNPEDKEKEDTTEVDVENLFSDKPESVGSGNEDIEERKDTSSTEEGTSPKNFYSSIANALVEDGVTPDLDTSKIQDAESFANAMKSYYESQLDETQKRINDALNNGVEPSEIKFYEDTIKSLNSINDGFIEDEKNEDFRKRAIYQDLINRGYSKEDAQEELQEILDFGNDVKRAKRAVSSMKDFYNRKYQEVLNEAKEETEREQQIQKDRIEALKKDMLNNSVFEDLELSKEERQRAYDAMVKPVWKDPNSGEYYTAIQKYEKEHKEDFIKKLAVLYVKTNGFESIDALVKGKVNKESKKALRELESKLSNTRRTTDGNLMFAGDTKDTESIFKGYSLDI